jgi:hypothetical protein
VLQLDPDKLNAVSAAYKFDPFTDKPAFDAGEPIVDDAKFVDEITNTTTGANLLTIAAKIPFRDLGNTTFTIPAGTPVGFYSDFQGGGSIFDCSLLRDLEITIRLCPSTDDCHYWRMLADCDSGYSMVACYGGFPE